MIDAAGRVLPDFLVVGAMRAGTNSLGHDLGAHPEICMARRELHFFDRDENWQRGADYYARRFSPAPGERVVGERTPSYAVSSRRLDPPVPERIARMLPEVRLVWLLRDPVDRAWSHHWYDVGRGRETRSFEQVIEAESAGGETARYLLRGLYARQIRDFLAWFAPDRMHFVVSEDLYADPGRELRGLFAFLGVDPARLATGPGVARNSSARVARVGWIQRLLDRGGRPSKRRRRVQRLNTRVAARSRPEMAPTTRAWLEAYFARENTGLARLIDRDLSHWSQLEVRPEAGARP